MRPPINPKQIHQIFTNKEWQEHQPDFAPSKELSEKMQAHILQKVTEINRKAFRRQQFKRRMGTYAAAAVLILVAGFALLFDNAPKKQVQTSAQTALAKQAQPIVWKEVKNTSAAIEKVQLPDSSVVRLYPKSTLRYEIAFTKTFRDIYLDGKAYFKVKKDHKRPFSVFAGGLKTTALGTSFTINTSSYQQKTSVKLHTGKIVVSPVDKSSTQIPVFLDEPGSGLLYNTQSMLASTLPLVKAIKVSPEKFMERKGSTLTIKNIPLKQVFALLSDAYKVKITTSDSELNRIAFTGKVDVEMESIEQILQTICLINNLSYTRGAEQEYILQKIK